MAHTKISDITNLIMKRKTKFRNSEVSIGFDRGIMRARESDVIICSARKRHMARKCFNLECSTGLSFSNFCITNKDLSLTQKEKIWESPHVGLYCCKCFKEKEKWEALKKKHKKLLNKADRICDKFGYDLR